MHWFQTNANAAVLWVGHPGQSGGQAIVEALHGKVNPSRRLTFTMYPDVNQVSFFTKSMRAPPGRIYKTGTPVYAFATGLSYTQFIYSP